MSVFLGVLFALCLLSVPLCGGRLGTLAELRLRGTGVIALAIGAQVVIISILPGGSAWLHDAIHISTYGLAAVFAWVNRRVPGIAIAAAGGLSNFAAIAANGGVMPASPSALHTAGLGVEHGAFQNSTAVAGAHLQWLGDTFAVPASFPVHNVFSVGDVLLVIGALIGLHIICGSRAALRAGLFPVTVTGFEVRRLGRQALVRLTMQPHRGLDPEALVVGDRRYEPLPGSTRALGFGVPVEELDRAMSVALPNGRQMNVPGHLSTGALMTSRNGDNRRAVIALVTAGDQVQGGTR